MKQDFAGSDNRAGFWNGQTLEKRKKYQISDGNTDRSG